MNEDKVSLHIGNKVIAFEPEPGNEDHAQFVQEMQAVAAKSPNSIQDFFIQLAEFQRSKKHRIITDEKKKKISRGI